MEETSSKFNINVVREVVVVADPKNALLIRKLIKGYEFLQSRDASDLLKHREEMFFVLAAVSLDDPREMQSLASLFGKIEAPLARKVVFVTAPDTPTREQMLFLQEIGVRFAAMGPTRNEDLKAFLKRICLEAYQSGPLESLEADVDRAQRSGDQVAMRRVLEKLKELKSQGEDTLRLLAIASEGAGATEQKRAESYLRRILSLNPQNLWAANALGKVYLRSGRMAEGIEILRKLSTFHELNGERLLALGDAYVTTGRSTEAEAVYRQGDELSAGHDTRFKDGLAKVKIAGQDFKGALTLLGDRGLSPDILSFLNMRAIMAIRAGKAEEGISFYACAFEGAREDSLVQAKLRFNMGLAYARTGDLEKAEICLIESATLGGAKFLRARKSLEVVRGAIKAQAKAGNAKAVTPTTIEADGEWETLF